jgi:hypothetical protein
MLRFGVSAVAIGIAFARSVLEAAGDDLQIVAVNERKGG